MGVKLNRPLIGVEKGLENGLDWREPLVRCRYRASTLTRRTSPMKSRAELLAEIEENRLENKEIREELNEFSLAEAGVTDGYNPYDHPGQPKEVPDGADITARRREIFLRNR